MHTYRMFFLRFPLTLSMRIPTPRVPAPCRFVRKGKQRPGSAGLIASTASFRSLIVRLVSFLLARRSFGAIHFCASKIVRIGHGLRVDKANIDFTSPPIEPSCRHHTLRWGPYGPMVCDHDCSRDDHGSHQDCDALPHTAACKSLPHPFRQSCPAPE